MELLIAEDDAALGSFLRRGLESEGYAVRLAADGAEALRSLAEFPPDLLILDLLLPEKDGMEVLRLLREGGLKLPVLVLTGRNELETRLRCLDLGADDCMFKPFSLQELRARCRALLRRMPAAAAGAEALLEVADLRIRRLERRVERGGRAIQLTNREYSLLEQLALAGGRCVTRPTLLDKVWGLEGTGTNVVDVYINYLRRKLCEGGEAPLIETVRGRGYRMPRVPGDGSLRTAAAGG